MRRPTRQSVPQVGGRALPRGGVTGQALIKRSDRHGDVEWGDVGGGGGGGLPDPSAAADGMTLTVNSGEAQWTNRSYPLFIPISEADLIGHVPIKFCGAFNGYAVIGISVIVQKNITTGGTVKLKIDGTDVVGSTLTVSDGDVAGTRYGAVLIDPTIAINFTSILEVVTAGFAAAGAVNVILDFSSVQPVE